MSILALIVAAAAQALPIETATLPLPPELRADASIVSMDRQANVTVLREGSGKMICIADRPSDERFDARCYHREFIPYLFRIRELGATGMNRKDVRLKVRQEVEEGTLEMTMAPTAGYRMLGPIEAIAEDGTGWTDEMRRWQSIHIPNAKAEDLGFVTSNEDLMPYVMASGELWSHIMINSPPN